MKHRYRPIHLCKRKAPEQPDEASQGPMLYRYNEGRQRADQRVLENAVALVMEHFEAVQILASRAANDGTAYISRGAGNWYTRSGMAREFLIRDEADTWVRTQRIDDDPPSPEEV